MKLVASIDHWYTQSIRAVWLKIPLSHSSLIAVAAKQHFVFHHAESHMVCMTRWLPATTSDLHHQQVSSSPAPSSSTSKSSSSPASATSASSHQNVSKIPMYCSHFIGAGGAVIDEHTQRILLIQEKYKFVTDHASDAVHWKIPGGAIDVHENIGTCAEREVREETGITAAFKGVMGFRHMHNFRFQRGDIYFLCLLKPTSFDIQFDHEEIAACQWFSVSSSCFFFVFNF